MSVLKDVLPTPSLSIYVVAEVLQILGWLAHEPSREMRFGILLSNLRHESPIIRDAAACALATMDDPRASEYLQAAIAREPQPSLRDDMQSVLAQLNS